MSTWDRLEHFRKQYAALNPHWEASTQRYQHWVSERLTSQSRVLDLGCGRGGIVERLQATGRWIGIDPDWLSLKEHRLSSLPRGQAASERLPFAAHTFDIVIASWVLEHVANPQALFSEVARILRPDGHFFYLTPNRRHPIPRLSHWLAGAIHQQKQWVARIYGRRAEDTFPVFYRCNTPEQIAFRAQEAGFEKIREEIIADPSYFAWNKPTFQLALGLEQLIPPSWKVHLIGEYLYRA